MARLFTFLFLFFIIQGCAEKPEDSPAPDSCSAVLQIDGVIENFCNLPSYEHESNFTTKDELYLQYENLQGHLSSANFEKFYIAITTTKPLSKNWESETNFFEEIISIYKPESLHPLDTDQLGGIGIELWDKDGNYFSSELGNGNENVNIEVRELSLEYVGPVYGAVATQVTLTLYSNSPITVWNEANNISHQIEMPFYEMYFTFDPDI